MRLTRVRVAARRVAGAAPVVSIVALLLLPHIGVQSSAVQQVLASRHADVQAAIKRVPYRIGDWVGEEVDVLDAAIELLRPNAILSRSYRRLEDGFSLSLLVVHCTDARDMGGHYPPICYPKSGWDRRGDTQDSSATIEINGKPIPMRLYEFRRLDKWGTEQRLRVLNAFVLPNGHTTVALADVRRQADRPTVSRHGVAQIQVVMAGTSSRGESIEAAQDLLCGLSDLLTVLGQGEFNDYAAVTTN